MKTHAASNLPPISLQSHAHHLACIGVSVFSAAEAERIAAGLGLGVPKARPQMPQQASELMRCRVDGGHKDLEC